MMLRLYWIIGTKPRISFTCSKRHLFCLRPRSTPGFRSPHSTKHALHTPPLPQCPIDDDPAAHVPVRHHVSMFLWGQTDATQYTNRVKTNARDAQCVCVLLSSMLNAPLRFLALPYIYGSWRLHLESCSSSFSPSITALVLVLLLYQSLLKSFLPP